MGDGKHDRLRRLSIRTNRPFKNPHDLRGPPGEIRGLFPIDIIGDRATIGYGIDASRHGLTGGTVVVV